MLNGFFDVLAAVEVMLLVIGDDGFPVNFTAILLFFISMMLLIMLVLMLLMLILPSLLIVALFQHNCWSHEKSGYEGFTAPKLFSLDATSSSSILNEGKNAFVRKRVS